MKIRIHTSLVFGLSLVCSLATSRGGNDVYRNAIMADNPVAYWEFEETDGTTAADTSANGNDGTLIGAVNLGSESAEPNLGNAADLAGGYLDVPVIGSFAQSTVEFWLQMDRHTGGCCVSVMSAGAWTTNALHFNIKGGFDLEYAVNGSGTGANKNTAPNTIAADGTTWYHIAVTNEPNSTIFYVNGEMVSDNGDHTNAVVDYGNSNFQIGAWNGSRLLDGRIDEIAIFDTVLSAERILAHFNAATLVAGPDNDGDGLPNDWETDNGLDPDDDGTVGESSPGAKDGPNGADGDPDGDRLVNSDEFLRGTDPQDDDSDDDGLKDGDELDTYNTNPKNDDSDGDGLKDGDEVNTHGTLPENADTDEDGIEDGEEITLGTNPIEADSDGDGFSDGFEINTLETDPLDPDDPKIERGVSPYADAVLADGPVAYWRFEELDGNLAVDSSVSGHHGTYTGSVDLGAPSFHPNLGSAADLTGGFIDVPVIGSFEESTVETWIQLDALAAGCCTSIMSAGTWTTRALHWNLKSDRVFEHAVNASRNVNTAPGSFETDGTTWYHIAVTSRIGETIWYVNGEMVGDNGDHSSAIDYGNTNNQIGAWNGGRLLDGRIDEFAIYDKVLTAEQILAHFEAATADAPRDFPLRISHDRDAETLTIRWDSRDGRLYNLRSEIDPSVAEPIDWPIFEGNQDLEATPPENSVTFPFPDDAERFFVVEEFPAPPVSIFSDDFESGQGDWTVGSAGLDGTEWQLGAPTGVGPNGAHSPDNCFATNIALDYAVDANIWLRSPPIDLSTASDATVRFYHFFDIEEGFDLGRVSVLDAGDNSELAVLEDVVDGVSPDWEQVTKKLPAAAVGKTIIIEFRFQSDDLQNFAGWYIDDFEVTVP